MAASTADRSSSTRTVDTLPCPVAASTVIYLYTHVCYDGNGNIVLASNTSGLTYAGQAFAHADNSAGIAGAVNCPVRPPGVANDSRFHIFDCSGATQAWVGVTAYFVDDHTVLNAASGGASNGIKAGRVTQFIDATHVLVDTAATP